MITQITKANVDNIRRSRLSRSDYANYIDYPPRILMTVQQTVLSQQQQQQNQQSANIASLRRPKLKLKGTVPESSFNLPLPVPHNPSPSSPSPGQGESMELNNNFSSPVTSSSRTDVRTLLSPLSQQKFRSLHSMPDLKELGERVTPHVHHKWYHIGIQMELQPATLEALEIKHPTDIQRRLDEVFQEWISRSEQNPTWMMLIEILRLDSIGERKLALELERSFS